MKFFTGGTQKFVISYMIRCLAEIVFACFKLEERFCEFSVGVCCDLAVLNLARNVIAYCDPPSLHVYQFFCGDVTLHLIYQN